VKLDINTGKKRRYLKKPNDVNHLNWPYLGPGWPSLVKLERKMDGAWRGQSAAKIVPKKQSLGSKR
jgi:hypothetical protein